MLMLGKSRVRFTLVALVGVGALARAPGPVHAQDPAAQAAAPAAEIARLKADVARLEQELTQQKQLLIQLMQGEQQRYDMLMQLIRSGQVPRSGELRPTPTPGNGIAPMATPTPGAPASDAAARAGDPAAAPARSAATVSGKVRFPAAPVEAYVYVEGLRGGSGRGRTLQIKQEGKQFIPAVAVVLTGTKLTFPNFDSVAHNAFSSSPGNAFDLGSINAGEKSAADVTLGRPGPVTVHCNIHAKMRADILVTSSGHFAKVRPDGGFDISSVPVGVRKVTLWSPDLKAVSQTVEVTARGASLTFAAQPSARGPHLNKQGRSYGSYND